MGSFTPPPRGERDRALAPGDRLDRYELLCVLAQGGMGTVWLARMTGKLGFERLVALKTILPTYSGDRQFSDMFMDEAKIAAQIDHENVARILEIGEDRGLLYYAMELIDGESLRKLYRDVRAADVVFPMGVAMRIVADACAGLHATHELRGVDGQPLGVVHRDVSPQNLLITIRGTTKLIDFGVAKANARSSEETAAGTLKGKIEYMAPEQAKGLPLDRRADVYALGAVLYELLAGRPVRATDEGRQLAALHDLMTGAPVLPLPRHVPPQVAGVVARAIAREAGQRFSSAEELRRALEHAMTVTGLLASTDDVAAMLAHFSGARTAKRKDAVERALRAATDGRLNAATIVAPLSAQVMPAHGGSQPGGGSHPGAGSHPSHHGSAPGSGPSHHGSGPGSVSGYLGNAGSTGPFLPMPSPSGFAADGSSTGPSMRTLGAASMSAHPAPGSSAAKIFAGVLVLAIVLLTGIVAGVLVTRRNQHSPPVVVAASSDAPVAPGEPGGGPTGVPPVAVPVTSTDSPAPVAPPVAPPTGVALAAGAAAATEPAPARSAAPPRAAKDASAATGGAPARKPAPTKPARAGKPGDGDEYGF